MNRKPLQDPPQGLKQASDQASHAQNPRKSEHSETAKTAETAEPYILKLYIAGMTPLSLRSIENAKRICEEHLADRYQLEVIDIRQQPQLAKGAQITAAPTLIREMPLPLRRVVGDLSDTQHVLLGLDLKRRR
jgi:circadian clock protein KaiB